MGTEEFIKQEEEHVLSVSRRGRRTSEAVGRLPYALIKTPTAAASAGSWFTISPSPSSGETHLAPCWTLIRPDSHRMVPWSWLRSRVVQRWGRQPHLSSAGSRLEPSSLPGARAPRRGLAKDAVQGSPFGGQFVTRSFWKGKEQNS